MNEAIYCEILEESVTIHKEDEGGFIELMLMPGLFNVNSSTGNMLNVENVATLNTLSLYNIAGLPFTCLSQNNLIKV